MFFYIFKDKVPNFKKRTQCKHYFVIIIMKANNLVLERKLLKQRNADRKLGSSFRKLYF